VRFTFNRYLPLALAVFAACALESCVIFDLFDNFGTLARLKKSGITWTLPGGSLERRISPNILSAHLSSSSMSLGRIR
jgi:hypothetical protein